MVLLVKSELEIIVDASGCNLHDSAASAGVSAGPDSFDRRWIAVLTPAM